MQRIDRNKNEFTEEKRKKQNVICTKIHDIEKSRNTSQKRTAKQPASRKEPKSGKEGFFTPLYFT